MIQIPHQTVHGHTVDFWCVSTLGGRFDRPTAREKHSDAMYDIDLLTSCAHVDLILKSLCLWHPFLEKHKI